MTKLKLRNKIIRAIQKVIDSEAASISIIDVLEVLKKFNLTMRFKMIKRKWHVK